MPGSRSRPFFFFNDTATTEIYTLSLHDALPIYPGSGAFQGPPWGAIRAPPRCRSRAPRSLTLAPRPPRRSEEDTSELQSLAYLVCRLLLEKKTCVESPTPTPPPS